MSCYQSLSKEKRQTIVDGLSVVLANTYTLYLTTQNFHWNVSGVEFYSLHLLFEKQYEELAVAIDEIAERIRALDFYVDGTFSGFKKIATFGQESKVLSSKEMLLHLIDGHEQLISHMRKITEGCDQVKDFATVDLLGKRLVVHEKMAWFLRSQL